MRLITVIVVSLLLGVSSVSADYDPVLEAQEAAERAAAARADQARKAKAEQEAAAAKAKYEAEVMRERREELGQQAVGKSDAEVNRMYDEKRKAAAAEAATLASEAQTKMNDPDANAKMKAATGKSMQDIMNMSPEEQEAWAAEMEQKMGAAQ